MGVFGDALRSRALPARDRDAVCLSGAGFPLETLAGLLAFRGIWAIYIHSNVRLPLGPLRVVVGAPELHHWHHARARDAGNYANISPLMDWMFGTYRCPDHEPEEFGVAEPMPKGYMRQLWHPFHRGSQK